MRLSSFLLMVAALLGQCVPAQAQFANHTPASLQASQLAIVINDDEPNSVTIGEYYRQMREIPAKNVVHVHIPNKPHTLDVASFNKLKAHIDAQLGPDIEAVLMIWTAPYAVECNAITSAFSLGFDAAQCARTCDPGKMSPYFNALPGRPYTDHGVRLSMLLPTESVEHAKELIGRGVASGFHTPAATAYYLTTSETPRNSRARFFPPNGRLQLQKLSVKRVSADVLDGAQDIMLYQTGMARVAGLEKLHFVPGALADHLTSFGGDLLADGQMSALRWLDAGATASYGTVTEPCNYWQKFPNPTVLIKAYASGASAIEAYWKSVAWPAQGVFIGEPLAAPYRR